MMTTSRTYDATQLSAFLGEFKNSLRITGTDMDTELTRELKASVCHCESFVGFKIMKSSFTVSGSFTSSLRLQGPVISLTSVTVDGTTLESSQYTLEEDVLTITDEDVIETGSSLTVQYTAGLAEVPEDIRQAVYLYASFLFNSPVDTVDSLPRTSSKLLRPYRAYRR